MNRVLVIFRYALACLQNMKHKNMQDRKKSKKIEILKNK